VTRSCLLHLMCSTAGATLLIHCIVNVPCCDHGRCATCRAEVADAEDLSAFADGTFDVVTCSAGLMLVPDHNKCVLFWSMRWF
jgi:Methyltransferase domain